MKSILLFSLGFLTNNLYASKLPDCTTDPLATSNKCENVNCTSYLECQSYLCTTLQGVFGPCINNELAPLG